MVTKMTDKIGYKLRNCCLRSMYIFLSNVSNLLSYFQPILVAIFVTIVTVKVKLIPDSYTWTIVLINL